MFLGTELQAEHRGPEHSYKWAFVVSLPSCADLEPKRRMAPSASPGPGCPCPHLYPPGRRLSPPATFPTHPQELITSVRSPSSILIFQSSTSQRQFSNPQDSIKSGSAHLSHRLFENPERATTIVFLPRAPASLASFCVSSCPAIDRL